MGDLAPELNDEFLVWRIWNEKGVPLKEIQEYWSYEDLLKANALLDMKDDFELALEAVQEEELARK